MGRAGVNPLFSVHSPVFSLRLNSGFAEIRLGPDPNNSFRHLRCPVWDASRFGLSHRSVITERPERDSAHRPQVLDLARLRSVLIKATLCRWPHYKKVFGDQVQTREETHPLG
jgi:hypothetical protein